MQELNEGQEEAILALIEAALEIEKEGSLEALGKLFRALDDLRYETHETIYLPHSPSHAVSFWRDFMGIAGKKGKT